MYLYFSAHVRVLSGPGPSTMLFCPDFGGLRTHASTGRAWEGLSHTHKHSATLSCVRVAHARKYIDICMCDEALHIYNVCHLHAPAPRICLRICGANRANMRTSNMMVYMSTSMCVMSVPKTGSNTEITLKSTFSPHTRTRPLTHYTHNMLHNGVNM